MTVEIAIGCPRGCFDLAVRGRSREHLLDTAVENDGPSPCPNCGETTDWEWSP